MAATSRIAEYHQRGRLRQNIAGERHPFAGELIQDLDYRPRAQVVVSARYFGALNISWIMAEKIDVIFFIASSRCVDATTVTQVV